MKKTSILGLLLLAFMPLFAEHVDPETARKVATTFLSNNGTKSDQLTDISKSAGFQNLYIFTTEESFVVMAADDCAKPILGYSLTGKFVTKDMPENLKGWLQGYDDEILYAIDNQARASSETVQLWNDLKAGKPDAAKTSTVVEPLIQTKWDQQGKMFSGKYVVLFNNLCPEVTFNTDLNGGHAYTGCVATAMAQIMYYHQHTSHTSHGIGSHSYIHYAFGEQSANFSETTYDWDHMTLEYNNNSSEEEKLAVATLMYHCGIAVDMDYGTTGSGARSIDIPDALINYFNYSVTAKNKYRYSTTPIDSTSYWIADMKAELDAGRPMEYYGNKTNGGGHAFICDGYNSNDEFHFNWGWGGNDNGYFSLITGATNEIKYKNNQGAIFGIKPAICAIGAPPGFTATLAPETRDVTLNWTAVSDAVGYKIFRNGFLLETIPSGESTSFVDEKIPYRSNVYHIRSIDSAGEMSEPSEYKTVTITFEAPTELNASQSSTGTVRLSWSGCDGAVSYNIYRNNLLVASNVVETAYEDTNPISGTLSYVVQGVDVWGDESSASNASTIEKLFNAPIVDNLSVSLLNQDTILSWSAPQWCYPNTPSAVVSHGDGDEYLVANFHYYAHRYPASQLVQYADKSVYKASLKLKYAGKYTVYVYTNTVDGKPDANALEDICVLKCQLGGWLDIPFSHHINVSGDKDLWIVVKPEVDHISYPIETFKLSSYNANACFVGQTSSDPTDLSSYPGYNFSWYIKAYLTDGTYTYNLYDGTTKVNGDTPIAGTSYTVENVANDRVHQYTVKTNYYGGESAASNKVGIALGTAELESLNLSGDNKMTVTTGSTLTVTGSITNDDPANLIVEDGGQLIPANAVAATMRKNIASYSSATGLGNTDGWHFIALPLDDNEYSPTDAMLSGTYDLYRLNPTTTTWENFKQTGDHYHFKLTNGQGYLYANNTDDFTIDFAGTVKASAESQTVDVLAGWNLIGNPFTYNVHALTSYYVMNAERTGLNPTMKSSSDVIKPCEGIVVNAASSGSVTFSKTIESSTNNNGNIQIAVTEQVATRKSTSTSMTDKAIVSFNEGDELCKFYFGSQNANIYIPQDGEEYAIAHSESQGVIPVCFKAKADGEYTITVNPEKVEMSCLLLIDNITGKEVDLMVSPSYIFNAKTNDYASRFKLAFSTKSNNNETVAESFAFISDGQIIVTDTYDNATLQVIDMTGRVVMTCRGGAHTVPTTGMTPGVYVLRIIAENKIKTQKIIIK